MAWIIALLSIVHNEKEFVEVPHLALFRRNPPKFRNGPVRVRSLPTLNVYHNSNISGQRRICVVKMGKFIIGASGNKKELVHHKAALLCTRPF